MDEKKNQKIVVLATGGTMAGLAEDVSKPEQYQAAVVPIEQLLVNVRPLFETKHGIQLHAEQVAQVDSKDMGPDVWRALAQRLVHWLDASDVQGVVVTHGSDTLEETACFLQAVINPQKPVVLTCAMRPANAPDSDGPGNLYDALVVASRPELGGVLMVCGGSVHAGLGVQKIQSHDLKPFVSRVGPVGRLVAGKFHDLQPLPVAKFAWPMPEPKDVPPSHEWPRVELVFNHAGANGQNVRDMMQSAHPPQGLVVAGTGGGTVHHALEAALTAAQEKGVYVVRTSRCALGAASTSPDDALPALPDMTPAQARVALQLALLKKGLKRPRL